MVTSEKLFLKSINNLILAKAQDLYKKRNIREDIDYIHFKKLSSITSVEHLFELSNQQGNYYLISKIRYPMNYNEILLNDFSEENKKNQWLLSVLYNFLDNKLTENRLLTQFKILKQQTKEKLKERRLEEKLK